MLASIAIRSEDHSVSYAELADIADIQLIIRARFIEAADTMAHMEVRNLRPAAMRSFWPETPIELGVAGHHPGYGLNGTRVAYRPSSKAISRAEEVMYGWLLDLVDKDETRILLGKWSMCLAAPRIAGSWRQYCKKTGKSRSTAERRINNAFESIAGSFYKNVQSLQPPNWNRVMPMMPNQASDLDKMGTVTHWMAHDAKPSGHSHLRAIK